MRNLILLLLAALPLSASQRLHRPWGHRRPRPIVVIRPAHPVCAPAPVIVLGHRHRGHRRHRRPVIVVR